VHNSYRSFQFLVFLGRRRGRLVRNYFFIFVTLIAGGMILSGLTEIYFRSSETGADRSASGRNRQCGARKDSAVHLTIEGQMKSTSLSQQIAEQGFAPANQFELMKLLYVAPGHCEAAAIDRDGVPASTCPVSCDSPNEETDYASPRLSYSKTRRTFFSPVYFVRGSEPYVTMAVPIEEFPGSVIVSSKRR